MQIMVTGCAGFIGSDLCEYLLAKKHEVIGVDNFNDYYDPNVKEFNVSEYKNNQRFKLYRVDITDRVALWKVFDENNIEAVVHLAAWAGVTESIKRPKVYVDSNIAGTNNLAEFGIQNSLKNFIFASTSSVYGNNQVPYKEEMNTDYPLAPYPATKKAGEVLLYTYHVNFDLNVTIFRFFNPLGPRLRPDLALPKLVRAAEYGYNFTLYQGTDSARDYTCIDDMMDAIHAVLKKPFGYEVMNLGNSDPVKLQEILESVERVTCKRIKIVKGYRPGQMQITAADISKARKLVGYNPAVTLDQMVEKYFEWFIKQPEWYKKGEESWMK